ncbi:MAG TPA: hypothetical protein VFT91_11765 [Dehalococcoidia bacterium]|nr:hypothetical protein [Dehalococcoidia bacterium]
MTGRHPGPLYPAGCGAEARAIAIKPSMERRPQPQGQTFGSVHIAGPGQS